MRYIVIVFLLIMMSCDRSLPAQQDLPSADPGVAHHDPSEPPPAKPCKEINHCLITRGFQYKSIRKVIFRTFKKGTAFKEFLKEYTALEDHDFLAEQNVTNWDVKHEIRRIYIPEEIDSDVDFVVITSEPESHHYYVSGVMSHWVQRYGNEYIGWDCDDYSYILNGILHENDGNMQIDRPGYYFH
jgi:hypothetical protein